MTVGGMGFIPERLLMMMMMMITSGIMWVYLDTCEIGPTLMGMEGTVHVSLPGLCIARWDQFWIWINAMHSAFAQSLGQVAETAKPLERIGQKTKNFCR